MKFAFLFSGLRWTRLVIVALVCICSAEIATAQTPTKRVRFYFNFGNAVDIDLYGNESPLHVANFLQYVNNDLYDGSYIHRSQAGAALFLQGGSFYVPPSPNLTNLATLQIPTFDPVPNEFDANNGLSNIAGTLAAARTADPDSATSGWFINTTNNSGGFDPGPYTVFGSVSRGLDLLNAVSFSQRTIYSVYGQANPWLSSTAYSSAPLPSGSSLFVINQAVEISILDGDFNNDGVVNAADRTLWKNSYGQTGIQQADGNGNYIVDGEDLLIWQRNKGASISALATVNSVPEPSSMLLALAGIALWGRRFR